MWHFTHEKDIYCHVYERIDKPLVHIFIHLISHISMYVYIFIQTYILNSACSCITWPYCCRYFIYWHASWRWWRLSKPFDYIRSIIYILNRINHINCNSYVIVYPAFITICNINGNECRYHFYMIEICIKLLIILHSSLCFIFSHFFLNKLFFIYFFFFFVNSHEFNAFFYIS